MAESKIRVNTDSLSRTRRELQEKLERIRENVKRITEDMGTLNAMWEGEAHEAFTQAAEADLQFLTEVCDALQRIVGFENTAVTEYDRCEQQVSEMIAAIRI